MIVYKLIVFFLLQRLQKLLKKNDNIYSIKSKYRPKRLSAIKNEAVEYHFPLMTSFASN